MVCECCGRKKRLFESFAKIKSGEFEINLCVECNDLMYKIRDAYEADDENSAKTHIAKIEKHRQKSSKAFKKWKAAFLKKYTKNSNDLSKIDKSTTPEKTPE